MGTLFCVGLQRLEESSDSSGFEDANKDSAEYMSCHSDYRYALRWSSLLKIDSDLCVLFQ